MKNCRISYRIGLMSLFLILGLSSATLLAAENLLFSGTLVSEPCELDPLSSNTVDFDSVIIKTLYANTRSESKVFSIKLTNCNIAIGSKVTVALKGSESEALPGYLATTGTAQGIAIGLEYADATPLAFNKASSEFTLVDGSNELTLQAFVQGTPDAIESTSITAGDFSAIATVELNYP